MRLIDADKLIKRFKELKGVDSLANMFVTDVINEIKKQPTTYDTDKVVERLKEYAHSHICRAHVECPYSGNGDMNCENCGAMGALEIVKSGGIE